MKLNNLFINIANFVSIFFGSLTLYVWGCLILELNFNSLISLIWVPCFFTLCLVFCFFSYPIKWNVNEGYFSDTYVFFENKKLLNASMIFCLISIIICLKAVDAAFIFSWFFLSLSFVLMYFSSFRQKVDEGSNAFLEIDCSFKEICLLPCIGLSLVVLYVFSSMGNADDTHFISYIVSLIQHPDKVIFSTDTIFNDGGRNAIFVLNYGQSWEAFSAILSYFTDVDYLKIYFLYLPSLFLFLVPVPLFYFTKIYFPKHALISVSFALLMMVCWSTYNHLQGMFFIPRFYQGKAILLSFFLPLLILVSSRFFIEPDIKKGILICLLLVSCGGSSSTGLYISILVLGLCYFSFTKFDLKSFIHKGLLVLLLIIPNVMMIGIVKSQIDESKQVKIDLVSKFSKSDFAQLSIKNDTHKEYIRPINSMYWLFGDHRYLSIFLFMFALSFFLFCLDARIKINELKRFYLIVMIFAFSHPLAEFLSITTGPKNLIWRFHWSIPMSLIFCLFSATLFNFSQQVKEGIYTLNCFRLLPKWLLQFFLILPTIVIASLFLFQSAGHLSKSIKDSPVLFKTNIDALNVSKFIVKHELSTDKVLAINIVSEILPMLERKSELVTSRPLYWSHPFFNSREIYLRKQLQQLINNIDLLNKKDLVFFNSEINRRKITTLVFKKNSQSNFVIYNHLFPGYRCNQYNINWMVCKRFF